MTARIRRRLGRRRERGQTIVLAAVTLLLACLALFMTLNVTRAVHEKIRVQNAADAQAYSMAIQEARAYNYFAYTNRAIAGAFASLTMLHTYHSEISAGTEAYWAAATIHIEAEPCELALCCGPCPFCACPNPIHCAHAAEDLVKAAELFLDAGEMADAVQAMDPPFRTAVSAFNLMIQELKASQLAMLGSVSADLVSGRVNLVDGAGKSLNIPAGDDAGPVQLGARNVQLFASTPVYSEESEHKAKVMTDIVNASRHGWVKSRAAGLTGLLITPIVMAPMAEKIREKCGGGVFAIIQDPLIPGKGSAVIEGGVDRFTNLASPDAETAGDTVGSKDFWWLAGTCKHTCCPGAMWMPLAGPLGPAKIWTNNDGGGHEADLPSWLLYSGHDGDEHRLNVRQLLRGSGLNQGFIEFNSVNTRPYNQPSVYGYAKQDLRLNERGHHAPWEITPDGTLRLGLFGTQETLRIANQVPGSAVSKALVYYHRPRDWKEHPNFFNPYWRAKLHPFGHGEAAMVLGLALEADAAAIVTAYGINTASGNQSMSP